MFKKLFSTFVCFFICSIYSFALHTSTNSFNERIDNYEGYKEITFYNDSTSPKIYGFKILPLKDDKMCQWTHLSDTTITIPPLDKYNLKIYSKSPENTPKGQYGCLLQITPVILSDTINKNQVVIPIIVNFKLDGYVGKLDYENCSVTKNFIIDSKNMILGKLQNNCFANIETSARILSSAGTMLYDKYIGVIKKGKTFEVKFELPEYVNKNDIKYIEFYNFNNSEIIKKIPLEVSKKG